MTAFII